MKNHVVDNSLNNLGKTVLWQYDRAIRLLSIMKHMQVLYHCAVEQLWTFWTDKVLSIDTCGAFGCSVWGIFLGIPRPTVKGDDGRDRLIATSVYRKILKGAFYLMRATSSFEDILGYLEIIYGVGGDDNLSQWSVYVSEFGWTTNIDELNDVYQVGKAYEQGDICCYDHDGDGKVTNWKCIRDISMLENTGFDAISSYIVETSDKTNGMGDEETLLLKLYDPEGICRKIGGAPNNSLTISVEYEFGETTIKAVATRRRKCGVTLVDNQDLSITYGKSEYYDEMHRDQKALFEQKNSEFCPYPLGIKTNEPVPEVVFGFKEQENSQYEVNKAYSKGDVFGYVSDDGKAFNYECTEDISGGENSSFDAIKDKVKTTEKGDPFIGGFLDSNPPYNDMSSVIVLNYFPLLSQSSIETFLSVFPDETLRSVNSFIVNGRFVNGVQVWDGCSIEFQANRLYRGKYNGMMSLYKIDRGTWDGADYDLITDGETYCAYFAKNYSGISLLVILTTKLAEVFRGMTWGNKPSGLPPDWVDFYGVTDAIGDIANRIGLKKIPLYTAKSPMEGITYSANTEFRIDGKEVVRLADGTVRDIGNATFISNSLLIKLGQKG